MNLGLLEDFLSKTEKGVDGKPLYQGKAISAVMPVHVLGIMTDMHRLQNIADVYNMVLLEDAAEALGSRFARQHAGTFGLMGALSFNGNKIMTTGGGGMILTNDEALAHRARHLSRQAKTDPVEYVHDSIGYNYRMGNVQAAIGLAQLEQMEIFLDKKHQIAKQYDEAFRSNEAIRIQKHHPKSEPNHWLYTLRLPDSRGLMRQLAAKGIESRPLWRPMNQLPMFSKQPYISHRDIAGQLNRECLSIPCSTSLREAEQIEVIEEILGFA